MIITIDGKSKTVSKEEIEEAIQSLEFIKKAMFNNDYVKVELIGNRLKFTGVKI